jgi:hypothetical protein
LPWETRLPKAENRAVGGPQLSLEQSLIVLD